MQKLKDAISSLSIQQLDRFAPIALFFLVLLLCWKLAALFWWIIAPPQLIQIEQVNLGSQQTAVPNISSFALFQEVGAVAAGAETNIAMQLQGVVVASPMQNSSAVIKVGEIADLYTVGQPIGETSYQLSEVYWDRVVLRQNSGATKELKFASLGNLDQPMNPAAPANAVTSPNPAINNNGMSNTGNQSQRALGQAIEQIQENREQYLKNMGVNAGSGQGYEVTEQTPAALKNKLGLKSGDRILSLNGQAVGQGQTDAQLLEQAKRDGKVKIEIKRGDQVMTFQQDL